ncbi:MULTISPECIES: TetR/AcrR family transcriptional regulator [unclassified Nocardioides]|jgi:AcrR family transcriptional regulator|uniref:TetR/AcrR family transcriptional regulator n=1 Tax=unclassified Nocardioides TaxID=2615069 RepID=UPI000702C552|nr:MULTISPECIES: TetR/AcrR family transcriptional regulator [unclassified Nocardioides]KRC54885.1 TetR family transcriptional regulator [Nocardioides sp. Root79]KRC73771.1 TetR family transcriptional regulator [Nocardioides sp. Root240]
MSKDLPLLAAEPTERSDAARNRRALLDAAADLMGGCGVAALTMDAVATRAGVGKGTVFRRFGSREGLMASLLNHREEEWQAGVISGPPPLGPGAPPMDRLIAFGASRLRLHLDQAALIEAAGRTWGENHAVLGFASMHVRLLLGQLGVPGNLNYLATALIAPLSVPVLRQQIDHGGMSEDQVLAGWTELVHRIVEGTP